MENFDLLALQHHLARCTGGTLIRKVLPAPEPDGAGVLLRLDGPAEPWLLVSPGPLYPAALPLAAARAPSTTPSPFLMLLRKHLEGARVTSLRKVRLERILLLAAEKTIAGGARAPVTLVIELTGKSALLALTDREGAVLGASRQPAGRLLPGAPYAAPRRAPGRERIDPFAAGPEGPRRQELARHLANGLERFAPANDRRGFYRSLISAIEGFGPVYASELAARLLQAEHTPAAWLAAWDEFLGHLEKLRSPGPHTGHLHHPDDPCAADPVASAIPLEASRLGDDWTVERFPSLAAAAARCREETFSRSAVDRRRRALLRQLAQAGKRNRRLRAKLESDRSRFEAAEDFQRYGELLTGALDSFGGGRRKRGLDRVTVSDFYRPGAPEVEIPLNPRLSLVQNAQSYFRRHRRAERGLEAVVLRLEPLAREAALIEELRSAAELAESSEELHRVEGEAREAGLAAAAEKAPRAVPDARDGGGISGALNYTSADGLEILVGRSAKGNDRVTFKLAGPEDFWLHAAGMAGSHVVVRNPDRLATLPPKTLEQAAGLAAWYSKGRRSTSVDVHLTRRKWLKKPKGGAPGLVTLKRFETVLARPLPPADLSRAPGS